MKKLSYWAKQNTWKARLIIIASHLLLIILALFTGTRLLTMSIKLPGYLLYVFLLVYLVAVFVYPSVKKIRRNFASAYNKQKACDFVLAASAFCMLVVLSGNRDMPAQIFLPVPANTVSNTNIENKTAAEILASLKDRDKSTLTRQEKKILKQEFKHQLKVYAVAKLNGNKGDAANAGLIILAIIAAVGLLFLVAALACNLSCNGSDGAAIAVALLGTGAIILGLIAIIKKIKGKSEKKTLPGEQPG